MITLKANANETVNRLCYEDSVIAFYYSVCENYANGYIQPFITNLQTLITKVGIIMSTVSTRKVYISYCAKSINYLCNTVLDKPDLANKFNQLGINEKGNKGKHSLETNRLDLDRAVSTFNELIEAIANKYNLSAIKALTVTKRTRGNSNSNNNSQPHQSYQEYYDSLRSHNRQNQNTQNNSSNTTHSSSRPASTPRSRQANEQTSIQDDLYVSLDVKLEKGQGYYMKGLINKKRMLNLKLIVDIGKDEYRFKSLYVTFRCRNNRITKNIPITSDIYQMTTMDVDLDAALFSGNITATVTGTYKIGLLKTKTIRASVSKTF